MTPTLAERTIKRLIENKVRKELERKEVTQVAAFESEPRELPLSKKEAGEKLARSS